MHINPTTARTALNIPVMAFHRVCKAVDVAPTTKGKPRKVTLFEMIRLFVYNDFLKCGLRPKTAAAFTRNIHIEQIEAALRSKERLWLVVRRGTDDDSNFYSRLATDADFGHIVRAAQFESIPVVAVVITDAANRAKDLIHE